MTNVTTFSGKRAYRASAAKAPSSSSGASARSQRPSARSRRLLFRTLSRIASIIAGRRSRRDAFAVPDADHVVERVALDRHLAGVANDPEELLASEAGRRLGARHVLHALVLQGAVDVVGAEVQRDRRRLLAQEYPVRLDVGEDVEQQPRGRDRSYVIGGRRRARHEPGRPDLVGQRDEGEKT